MARRRSTFLTLLLAGLLFAAANLVHDRMSAYEREVSEKHQTFHFYSGSFMRRASLGYTSLAADLLYLKLLMVVEWLDTRNNNFEWVYDIAEALTNLDPDFKMPYKMSAVILTEGNRQAIENAIKLYKKGAAHFKDDWRFDFYIAFNYYFVLKEEQKSVPYFESACHHPRAPSYMCSYVTRLEGKQKIESQLSLLAEVYCSQGVVENKPNFIDKAESVLKHVENGNLRADLRLRFKNLLDRCVK